MAAPTAPGAAAKWNSAVGDFLAALASETVERLSRRVDLGQKYFEPGYPSRTVTLLQILTRAYKSMVFSPVVSIAQFVPEAMQQEANEVVDTYSFLEEAMCYMKPKKPRRGPAKGASIHQTNTAKAAYQAVQFEVLFEPFLALVLDDLLSSNPGFTNPIPAALRNELMRPTCGALKVSRGACLALRCPQL